jgi:SAM-dependent MidA family methyltransferase
VTGLFFSNELVDAFPVHRIQAVAGQVKELFVDDRDGRFEECLLSPSNPTLEQHIQHEPNLADGYRTEVNLQALQWMEQVAERIDVIRGDHRLAIQRRICTDRIEGWNIPLLLPTTDRRCALPGIGQQDTTAHVDFTSLVPA